MSTDDLKFQVFISHSSVDTWVARQIEHHIKLHGGSTFLDEADIQHGDDFEQTILIALRESHELLVLLTPWSIKRPYIWLEIGAIWGQGKRIVGVLHGISVNELITQEGTPALLKRIDLLDINNIDTYLDQLRNRIDRTRDEND